MNVLILFEVTVLSLAHFGTTAIFTAREKCSEFKYLSALGPLNFIRPLRTLAGNQVPC